MNISPKYDNSSSCPNKQTGSRRKGSIFILVAASLMMILGFCALSADIGGLNMDANRVQRACDAAALAGVRKLKQQVVVPAGAGGQYTRGDVYDQYLARQEAILVARVNNVTLTESDITFPTSTSNPRGWFDGTRIQVVGTTTRKFLFAPIWKIYNTSTSNAGMDGAVLTRKATAEISSLSTVGSSVPLAITTQDYLTNIDGGSFTVQLERMQNGDGFDSAVTNAAKGITRYNIVTNTAAAPMGEAVALDTDPGNNGKSPSWWEDGVRDGVNEPVTLGVDYSSDTAINANLGNQSDRAIDALETGANSRISRAAAAGYVAPSESIADTADTGFPNYPGASSARVFTIMVADPQGSVSGNNLVNIKYFAVVYLVGVAMDGQGSARRVQLRLRILNKFMTNTDGSSTIAGNNYILTTPSNSSTFNNNGPLTTRLIDDIRPN